MFGDTSEIFQLTRCSLDEFLILTATHSIQVRNFLRLHVISKWFRSYCFRVVFMNNNKMMMVSLKSSKWAKKSGTGAGWWWESVSHSEECSKASEGHIKMIEHCLGRHCSLFTFLRVTIFMQSS